MKTIKLVRWFGLILVLIGGVISLNPLHFVTAAQTTPAPTSVATALPTQSIIADDTAWFKDTVMYSLFVRSFRDSNGDGIGDLQGVIDGLDYIQSLGVNTIWLLPVFKSPSYHGYDISDYYTVNPDYGTSDDLIRLDREVHKRHMHILLDYVVNHTSNQHPYFKDAYGNPGSQYSDYYNWLNPEHTKYGSFSGVDSMPTLNYNSPKVHQFAIDIALHWLDPLGNGDLSAGVDGYRCDVASGPPHVFWQELRAAMTVKNPKSLLLGELWLNTPKLISDYLQGNEFDAAFDFPLYSALGGKPDYNGDGALSGTNPGFAGLFLKSGLKQYPPNAYVVRFTNNHDTNRIMSDVKGDMARARAAAVFELTVPGVPVLYYGEELGMKGEKGSAPGNDAYRRESLPWYASLSGTGQTSWFKPSDVDYNTPNSGVSVQEEDGKPDSLLTLYRTLAKLRNDNPEFRTNNLANFDLPNLSGKASVLYELRVWDGKNLFVVVINFSTTSIDWSPTGAFAVNTQIYKSANSAILSQGISQASDGQSWTITPAGYAVFQASAS